MKNFGKNLFIAFLMILAIYQTTELWFDDLSSHNFFSFILQQNNGYAQAQLYGLDGVIINRGENTTALMHRENVLDNTYRREFDKLITAAVTKGEFEKKKVDWPHVFNNRCIVYSFMQPIAAKDFKKALGISAGKPDEIKSVSAVVIVPNTTDNVLMTYIENDSETICYKLKRADMVQKCTDVVENFSETGNGCISSKASGFNIFKGNTFIPILSGGVSTLNVTNPVTDGVMIDTKALENIADSFFDNPAVKWSSVVNNIYSYSDEYNVVKYNLNGVLEYSGYNAGSSGEEQSPANNYAAALEFLKKDKGIKNDIVLSAVSTNKERTQFYFDYAVNGIPAYMSDNLKKGLEMHSAIELSVSHGNVVKYRRYLCVMEQNTDKSELTGDFVKAVDNVYNALEGNEMLVEDMDLAYKINGRQENVPVSWRITIDNKIYWEAA